MLASVMELSSPIMLALLATVITCIYLYLRSIFSFWKERGIPYVGPIVYFKNMKRLLLGRISFYDMQLDVYNSLSGHKYGGYYEFHKPVLMVRDPELVERILIKDFNYFVDRSTSTSSEDNMLTLNLANAEGERWRALRHKLTPTFTSGKLKGMFEQIDRCCDDMIQYIDEESANGDGQLECKPLMNRFAINVIATCAFGIEFSQHDKERQRFQAMVEKLMKPSLLGAVKFLVQQYIPVIFELVRIPAFVPEARDYFVSLVKEAIRYRTENNTRRNDFLQLLLDLKNNEENGVCVRNEDTADCEPDDAAINQMHHVSGHEHKSMEKILFTTESITAQAIVFLTAGSEAATGLMSFFLYAVATHPEIQSKLQKEVDGALQKHGEWNYQMLKDMTYIDQVIQETMRKYPSTVLLMRMCTKPYQLPHSDVVIQPGMQVVVPAYSLHSDPQYYPDPDKFDPERFIETNYKPNGRFLPFGDGPRICIAMRFALLKMKICLARLIADYNIKLGLKTSVPLQFEKRSFIILPKGGIWLKFEKRKGQHSIEN